MIKYLVKFICFFIPIKSWRENLKQLSLISFPKIRISKNNTVILTTRKANLKGLTIQINGNGNKVFIDTKSINILTSLDIFIDGDNNFIEILDGNKIDKITFMINSSNCTFKIGKECFMGGVTVNADPTACGRILKIGDNSIISTGIYFALGDEHPIYDINTKKVINAGANKNIEIGNNTWVCRNTIILKQTKVANNCIIGAGSIVKGQFNESNTIIAGNLAKVVKKNIYWEKYVSIQKVQEGDMIADN